MTHHPPHDAMTIAAQIQVGTMTAADAVDAALDRIARFDPVLNAFSAVTADRARAKAAEIDARRARGEALGALAGVPFAVKNLIDVAGLPTLSGSKINADRAPASADGFLVRRLEAADAVLVGALTMGEYAYDFTGENAHYGPSRNPHDPTHMTGGSSGGSGAAVAGGLVPLALGSDTNGSIRVPSSFCGIFGLKPTYGRLSRGGSFPFVGSLDHLGPFARSVKDLTLAYDLMQGTDEADPAQTPHPVELCLPELDRGIDGLRIAVAGGYFKQQLTHDAADAVATVAHALKAGSEVTIPEAARARAAAFAITMAEGGALHLNRLRARGPDFDPATRDRLIAGAMIPASWVVAAQKFRRWYRAAMLDLFRSVDVILAPSTPVTAPRIGQETMVLDGVEMLTRPNIGIFTQPISFIGLPVAAVPIHKPGRLPIGVQVIAAPWREDIALRVAAYLEDGGVAAAPVAPAFGG